MRLCNIDGVEQAIIRQADAVVVETFIAVVERRPFVRDCIGRSMQSALRVPVRAFSTLAELECHYGAASAGLVLLSLVDCDGDTWASTLQSLTEKCINYKIIILASSDVELARAAIRHGAKGYIPVTMDFDIAIQAIQFISAGGIYAPADLIVAENIVAPELPPCLDPVDVLTSREISVVKAIRQGKRNKIIAHEMNVRESTIKVHVRSIMQKWSARNRTEIAMKAQNAPSML